VNLIENGIRFQLLNFDANVQPAALTLRTVSLKWCAPTEKRSQGNRMSFTPKFSLLLVSAVTDNSNQI